eukprot:CAMPEP_0170077652 /NCGR_PEP_ID=MMETSP0019_2-20121128/14423_1 /TAXON_ID=98059 /ORGANISM="Dinobryon sp., Strain UTEXLB2267" /LENGTH=354 /DNA_ID=CAMNT_0010290103 /DNA_START=230 /DNA_END=1294 /DNA_ORIENTATION=-
MSTFALVDNADGAARLEGLAKLTKRNYSVWLAAMKIICSKAYGKQANLLKTNERFVYPAVVAADYTPPVGEGEAALTAASLSKLRLKAEEDRNGKAQKLLDNSPAFYATLWDAMSVESQQLVRVKPGHAEADLAEDPNLLWAIIRETHFTETAGGALMVVHERVRHCEEFAKFHQGKDETLGEFKVKYCDFRAQLTSMGVIVPSAEEEAMIFMRKLDDRRHGDMMQTLANDAARGTAWPATLDAAYKQASNWKVKTVVITGSEHSSGIQSSYVLADESNSTSRKRPRTAGGRGSSAKKAATEIRICRRCQKPGHLAADCRATAPVAVKSGGVAMVAIGELSDDDDEDSEILCAY